MARLTLLLTVLFLAIGSFAQVVVTNSGIATQSGPAFPATPVSPPIVYTPIIQLGQAPTQPSHPTAPAELLPAGGPQVSDDDTASTGVTVGRNTPFNFGVAQFDSGMGSGSVGEDINGKSLGELAREQRQHPVGTNARVYSNSDIDKLNQVGNAVSASAQANNTNDNWSPNNGIITPENSQPAANSVAAPAESNPSVPTGNHNPFAPKPRSQTTSPTGIDMTPSQPQTRTPQSEVRPFSKRAGPEMAQNNAESGPLAQEDRLSNAASAPAQNQQQTSQLPRTASRLPLVGVAGLFSVSLGIFVRYQRAKAR